MRRGVLYLVLAMSLCPVVINGQGGVNLVYNSSFEDHFDCPQRIEASGIMREVHGWWQPTAGSSDYFHACGGRETAVPRNKMGVQTAHSGDAYCGIYCSQEHYREYLQTELSSPLVAGRRYVVSFWVSLADKSPYAISNIGALLTVESISDTTYEPLQKREREGDQVIAVALRPQVTASVLLDDFRGWTEVKGEMVAQGGEKYLTIGNFADFNHSGVVASGVPNAVLQGAYYYVDDVSVFCQDCDEGERMDADEDIPLVGEVIVLEGVYFASDESEVLPQSFKELLDLREMMERWPTMQIEVRGHTDNRGTVTHNQQLSERRARAVVEYLIGCGIGRERMTFLGFGESQPVADNDTEEGRAANRRVEFRVVSL